MKMTTGNSIVRYFSQRQSHYPQREPRLPTLQSSNLFAMSREVRIEHDGEEYRLRLTRNNKLILTK